MCPFGTGINSSGIWGAESAPEPRRPPTFVGGPVEKRRKNTYVSRGGCCLPHGVANRNGAFAAAKNGVPTDKCFKQNSGPLSAFTDRLAQGLEAKCLEIFVG